MPVIKTECYSVECDGCQIDLAVTDHVPHFRTELEAVEEAETFDWVVWKGLIWCERCELPCACGHTFHNHDYGEGPCEDEDCDCKEYGPEESGS